MMKLKKKRAVEVPPRIRRFINNVLATPLENIEEPLTRFVWDFDKGDFHHWVDLFNHFGSYFEKLIKPRKDLQLEDDFIDCDPPFPSKGIIQVLRVIRIILENCTNKHFDSSYEQHFASLLASTDADVVEACLQTFSTFLKKPVWKYSIQEASFSSHLYSFAQGWGVKEEGLGLVACAAPQVSDHVAYELGCTLHFEFYVADSSKDHTGKKDTSQGLHVIHVPHVNGCQETNLELLNRLVKEHDVPSSLRLSLLTRVRFSRAFGSWLTRQQYTRIRLYAFAVLAQASSNADLLVSFFNNEPAFVHDLVNLLSSEDAVPEDIRILCVLSLVALCQDRSHLPAVLTAVTSGWHRGILTSLMHRAVFSITTNTSDWSVAFTEALLSLVTVLVSSSSGCSALRESGFIPILLPILKDTNPQHLHLVSTAVHVLEAFMDYFNPAAALFRDLGGLDETISRLKFEVSYIETSANKREEDHHRKNSELAPSVSLRESTIEPLYSEALVNYYRRLLMKALLRAISLGTYAPGINSRVYGSEESLLPQCLRVIFRRAKEFGGGVFSLAAAVMSDLIHKDPTCYPFLESAGLPSTFMDAIMEGVLCSAEAITSIPQCLDALCLNNNGLQAVKDRSALRCFVKIFTSKAYIHVLAGDVTDSLSTGLDELMRHVSSLRAPCVDMLIEILIEIAKMVSVPESLTPPADSSSCMDVVPMETDAEERKLVLSDETKNLMNGNSDKIVGSSDVSSNTLESFLPSYVKNAARLLETVLHNSEMCRIFVEKKGIEAVLQLLILPRMPLSSSIGQSVFLAFKNFSTQHFASLARVICTFFKDHLKSTNKLMLSAGGTPLAKIEESKRATVLRSLSSLEGILCLLNCWAKGTSNLAVASEVGAADSEIIKEIGKTYREVLWQISICYDSKLDETKLLNNDSQKADAAIERETGEDVRYMNPAAVRTPNHDWDVHREFVSAVRSESLHRRTRHGLSRVRGGRAGRHLDTMNIDPEDFADVPETSSHDLSKKNPDVLVLECLVKLASAIRAFLISLVKGFVVPNRRRAETGALSSSFKSIGSAIAKIFYEALNFQVHALTPGHETPLSVKCRYLGKVVDDLTVLTADNRKRNCYASMVNNFYVQGTFKELLTTFAATSQLLWTLFSIPAGVDRVMSSQEGMLSHNSWLLDTLQSYCNALDNFVNSALMLSPLSASHEQLLVQPAAISLSIGLFPVPREPAAFVKMLQLQVLDVLLPVWNHSMFANCSEAFITSVTSLMAHVYSDVGGVKQNRSGIASMGRRLAVPPPDEATVNTIVEMGFSRARAEEALRRVGMNSVEMAMEWLFTHADDPVQEDDELARALALSLGNESETSKSDSSERQEELLTDGLAEIPPVDVVITTATKLLLRNETLVFTLRDLFVTICNRNKGEDRPRVTSHLIQQLRLLLSSSCSKDTDAVCIISHFLALLISEDGNARKFVAENGFTSIAINMLTSLKLKSESTDEGLTPKCASALLIILDYLLQPTMDVPSETTESRQAVEVSNDLAGGGNPTTTLPPDPETESCNAFEKILGRSTGYLTYEECCKVLDIACDMIKQHVPALVMQALLQLCARLTKMHSLAVKFLDGGGLNALFTLPTICFFAGYDCIASAIIRHLLEDPQTLQTAMESEIWQALNRTGRVTTRDFLKSMAPFILRDSTVFMKAVASTCQLESTGGRTFVVLSMEKEKEKSKALSAEHGLSSNGSIHITENRTPDCPVKFYKSHKRVPANFSLVFDQLLDIILKYPSSDSPAVHSTSSNAMEIGRSISKAKGKSKVDETIQMEPEIESNDSTAIAKVTFILKLLGDIVLMYGLAAGVILKQDSEMCQLPRVGNIPQGGIIHHVLHRLLPLSSDKSAGSGEWKDKLPEKASWFLVALCGRSNEGRRRVMNEIVKGLSSLAKVESNSSNNILLPNYKVLAFVELVHSIFSKSSSTSNFSGSGFSSDILKSLIDSGIIKCLSYIIQVIDLDHPDAPKTTSLILKIIETLTRAANANVQIIKSDEVNKKKTLDLNGGATDQRVSFSTAGPNNLVLSGRPSQAAEITEQQLLNSPLTEVNNAANSTESAEASTARIDVDEIPDVDPPTVALDYIPEDVVQSADLHNSDQFGMQFYGGSRTRVDIGVDDHDMRDNGEDEDDVDDDEEDDVAEDAAGMLPLADTDVEDHDDAALGDEYNDDMVDEDDDFHENRVIEVRWREALDGLDHLHVLGQPGSSGGLIDVTAEPFEGVHVDDILGIGRTEHRRQTGRASLERSATDIHGFNHPLLHRPSSRLGDSSLLQSGGQPQRDIDSLSAGNLDTAHFYMLDAPVLPYDHLPSSLFRDRFSGNVATPLVDYSAGLDMLHWSGRRGQGDSRWTDNGQPQTDSHAAIIAQVLEQEFFDRIRSVTPTSINERRSENLNVQANDESVPVAQNNSPAVEDGTVGPYTTPGNSDTATGHQPNQIIENGSGEEHANIETPQHEVSLPDALSLQQHPSQIRPCHSNPMVTDDFVGAAHSDGYTIPSPVTNSSDHEGHHFPITESGNVVDSSRVQSVQTSEDGCCSISRVDERMGTDLTTDPEASNQNDGITSLGIASTDVIMGGAETGENTEVHPVFSSEDAVTNPSSGQNTHRPQDIIQSNNESSVVTAIDPTFLEALPDDLREEVLASQQAQTMEAPAYVPPSIDDIDPEFLAALPPDIQGEVLAQQRAQRIAQQGEGQAVEMDNASIIATFPAELREEVLLTSSEAVLQALPSSLLAEAQMLRDRAMSHYQTRGLYGGSHRLTSRRNYDRQAYMDRSVGSISRRVSSHAACLDIKEVEGRPFLDENALRGLIRLVRIAQPLGKGVLQRLLLNLCTHTATRAVLVHLLLDMIKPEAEGSLSASATMNLQRLYGCQPNVVYGRSPSLNGLPPLVLRRILENLFYLATNHSTVASLLFYFDVSLVLEEEFLKYSDGKLLKGKNKLLGSDSLSSVTPEKGEIPLILFLKLLNQPLFLRSNIHLEQLMGLIQVVVSNASSNLDKQSQTVHAPKENQTAVVASSAQEDSSTELPEPNIDNGQPGGVPQKDKVGSVDIRSIFLQLPYSDLHNLCSLFSCNGLSDKVYMLASEVLKKLALVALPLRKFFTSELSYVAQGLSDSAVRELVTFKESHMIGHGHSSMTGAAILRVLQALNSTISPNVEELFGTENDTEQELSIIWKLHVALDPLWQELSNCIGFTETQLEQNILHSVPNINLGEAVQGSVIAQSPSLPTGSQRLLPFIEAFFVLCDKLQANVTANFRDQGDINDVEVKESTSESSGSLFKSNATVLKKVDGAHVFARFAEKHRRLLNAYIRQNSGLLEKSLSILLKAPRLIDFDNKRAYFRSKIRQQHDHHLSGPLRISVRRAYILEDSYNQLRMRSTQDLKGRLNVQFQGEEGIDAGGLTREWYQLLSRVIFDKGALLFTTVGNNATFQPNPNSVYQTEHLSYFKFVGRLVAKALFDGQLLDVYFTRSFYKHILGVKVTYHDIEAIDPDYYKNLKWMLENDVSNIPDLTFSMDADEEKHILYEKTEVTDYELKPGGRNTRVTEETKQEYVDLVAGHLLTNAIRPQINAFLEGFNEMVPTELISIFNDKELELLISGLPEIDLNDLKFSTEYHGYTVASSVIQWFWEVVEAFSKEDMARLLQFVTGTSKVPLEGFKALQGISGAQRFQIHKAYGAPERLPSAHTCFNQLDLPEYATKEVLQERLLLAIHEASEGFGFG